LPEGLSGVDSPAKRHSRRDTLPDCHARPRAWRVENVNEAGMLTEELFEREPALHPSEWILTHVQKRDRDDFRMFHGRIVPVSRLHVRFVLTPHA